MSKRSIFSLATLALAVTCAFPVFAGGGGTGNVAVRMKNVGFDPVAVNSKSGTVPQEQLYAGATILAPNGIAQFKVNAGAFTAVAADPDFPEFVNKVRNFNTRTHKTIYLWAQQDYTTATLVGAPAGVKF